jgi:hypothetical protein
MWAVSRKRVGKCVATERLILGNQLVTEHVSMDTKTKCKRVKAGPLLRFVATDRHRVIHELLEVMVCIQLPRCLKSETVKYGREFQGTRTRERLRWQGPAVYTKDRPVLSSERAPHKMKTVTVKQ